MRCLVFYLGVLAAAAALTHPARSQAWERVSCPISDDLHNGCFVDTLHGWIVSYGTGVVLSSNDGGHVWSVCSRLDSIFYECMYFSNPDTGWICGEHGRLLHTVDGGRTWSNRDVGSASLAFYGVHFPSVMRGLLVGMDTETRTGVLYESSDGGRTWRANAAGSQGRNTGYEAIQFFDQRRGMVGGGRVVLQTEDAGRTWGATDLGKGVVIRSLHFADATNGWAVGHNGAVFRTTDGGRRWSRRTPFTPNRLRSVHFVSVNHGFVAGDANVNEGSLWETRDGGESWGVVPGDHGDMHRIFRSSRALWAVGKSGTILRMNTDGL